MYFLNLIKRTFYLWMILILSSCGQTTPTLFSQGDEEIITAPLFSESRIFFVSSPETQLNDQTNYLPLIAVNNRNLTQDHQQLAKDMPLSLHLESISLARKSLGDKPLDILVIVDLLDNSQTQTQQMAIWYERGVKPGRSLDFNDIVIQNTQNWTPSNLPFLRLRIIDMRFEDRLIIQQLLNDFSKANTVLSDFIKNPLISPALDVGEKIAEYTLANPKNRILVDFTFELDAIKQTSDNSYHLPLGQFLLFGLAPDIDREFWATATDLKYQTASRDVYLGNEIQDSPLVLLRFEAENDPVASSLLQRTQYLQKYFTPSGGVSDQTSFESALKTLVESYETYKNAQK